jgi:hypothetical protein
VNAINSPPIQLAILFKGDNFSYLYWAKRFADFSSQLFNTTVRRVELAFLDVELRS